MSLGCSMSVRFRRAPLTFFLRTPKAPDSWTHLPLYPATSLCFAANTGISGIPNGSQEPRGTPLRRVFKGGPMSNLDKGHLVVANLLGSWSRKEPPMAFCTWTSNEAMCCFWKDLCRKSPLKTKQRHETQIVFFVLLCFRLKLCKLNTSQDSRSKHGLLRAFFRPC